MDVVAVDGLAPEEAEPVEVGAEVTGADVAETDVSSGSPYWSRGGVFDELGGALRNWVIMVVAAGSLTTSTASLP